MRKNPYAIAIAMTLLALYPLYFLTIGGSLQQDIQPTNSLIAGLSAVALISFLSALLARPSENRKPKTSKPKRKRSKPEQRASEGPRESGAVKWFNGTKGFGFITRDSGEDIFVHFRSIRGEGHRTLRDGERVEFEVTDGDKGLQADDVVSLR